MDGDADDDDPREASDSLLPDSDDDEHAVLWQQLKSLPPAPDPTGEQKDEEDAWSTHISLHEREQATQASTDATKRRVKRLMEEAEERRKQLTEERKGQQTRRVKTSEESKLRGAGVQLTKLTGRRPASAENSAGEEKPPAAAAMR
jgi:hypothetical protein